GHKSSSPAITGAPTPGSPGSPGSPVPEQSITVTVIGREYEMLSGQKAGAAAAIQVPDSVMVKDVPVSPSITSSSLYQVTISYGMFTLILTVPPRHKRYPCPGS